MSLKLSSLHILKPKCECTKCNCKAKLPKLQELPKELQKPKVSKKPLKPKKPKVQKPRPKPKKIRKSVKKQHKKRRKHPKNRHTKPKRAKKIPQPSKSMMRVAKNELQKSIQKSQHQEAPIKTEPAPKPQKSANKSYAKTFLERYTLQIKEAIQRHKFYPRLARKTRKEGDVVVGFALTPQGMRDLRIVKPSPHKILDRAALRCVSEASSEFPKPKERVEVRVPMEYRLR